VLKTYIKSIAFIIAAIFAALAGYGQRLVVAKDGSGKFTTVQAALNAVPAQNKNPVEIYIKKGVYREPLTLPAGKDHVTMRGEDKNNTILTYDNHTGTVSPKGDTINTYTSATFFIQASDFKAFNLTFQNNAGFTAGQAVAVFAYGDKLAFDNCRFLGFQDVLFCSGLNSRQYYRNCYIEGTTDFIFGPATAVFQNCTIHSKKNSHVTAASTPKDHAYGFVFLDCKLTGDAGLNSVSLGRPWQPYSSVAYIRCNIGSHIIPEGWNNWKKPANEQTARYAEYENTGLGAQPLARAKWSKQLTDDEVKDYTVKNILAGNDNWMPLNNAIK
jgi:pectinesterase